MGRRILSAVIPAIAFAGFITGQAFASGRGAKVSQVAGSERYVSGGWNVVAKVPSSDVLKLSPGDIVLRHELAPVRLLRLSDEAVDSKSGKSLLSVGAWLFVIDSKVGVVACDLTSQSRTKMKFDFRSCLKDEDGDGRFETAALYIGAKGEVPIVAGYWPKRPKPLVNPVRYELNVRVPDEGQNYFMALRYSGVTLFNKLAFDLVCGKGEMVDVVGTVTVEKGRMPTALAYAGAEIDLISLSGKELGLRIRTPFPPGPLRVFPSDSAFGGAG